MSSVCQRPLLSFPAVMSNPGPPSSSPTEGVNPRWGPECVCIDEVSLISLRCVTSPCGVTCTGERRRTRCSSPRGPLDEKCTCFPQTCVITLPDSSCAADMVVNTLYYSIPVIWEAPAGADVGSSLTVAKAN